MSLMPIPWSKINEWAQYYSLDRFETDILHIHVRAMERAEREYSEKLKERNDSRRSN